MFLVFLEFLYILLEFFHSGEIYLKKGFGPTGPKAQLAHQAAAAFLPGGRCPVAAQTPRESEPDSPALPPAASRSPSAFKRRAAAAAPPPHTTRRRSPPPRRAAPCRKPPPAPPRCHATALRHLAAALRRRTVALPRSLAGAATLLPCRCRRRSSPVNR